MRFLRQEYGSRLPFPFPGDLPNPGIKPRSPALQADSTTEPPRKPRLSLVLLLIGFCVLSTIDFQEINPEHSLERLILWPPDVKNWLTGKDTDAGKDCRQEEMGTTEDEMVGWQHWLDGHESEQTPGDRKGQGTLVSCSPQNHKESDRTEWLNNNSLSAVRAR